MRSGSRHPNRKLSKAKAIWFKLREGKLAVNGPLKKRKRRGKKGKMSKELKAKRSYERHLAEGGRHGSHAIRGFGTLILRPINKTAAKVTR